MNNNIKIKGGNLPESARLFKEIMENPEKMFEILKIDMRERAEAAVNELIKLELSLFLGRGKYERQANVAAVNYRNGYAAAREYAVKGLGRIRVRVARDRGTKFRSRLIKKYDRYDKALGKDILAMFLAGMSTRNIELFSSQLLGRRISAGEVSRVNAEVEGAIEAWRTRSLAGVRIKYLMIDGVNFRMRTRAGVEKTPMLVVIGVTVTGERIFLAIQRGDKDSASCWREVFRDLKSRGLDPSDVKLGIMDGLRGLEAVFREEFGKADIQRCTVHVSRNVLSKVPRNLKGQVADGLRDIFYAGDKEAAVRKYEEFALKWEKELPSAVASLKGSINSCLTFYSFPKEEWVSLRTTNAIERVNKEFKRRTRPMEILAGERSGYLLLSFIAYKMELSWKRSPFGKRSFLPCIAEFTQNT